MVMRVVAKLNPVTTQLGQQAMLRNHGKEILPFLKENPTLDQGKCGAPSYYSIGSKTIVRRFNFFDTKFLFCT